jgi:hypothetical protein
VARLALAMGMLGDADAADATADEARPRPNGAAPRGPAPRGHGYLNVHSRPFGVPYVDGVQVARETPIAKLRLTAGQHEVKIYFPQEERYQTRSVRVHAGKTTGVVVVLAD